MEIITEFDFLTDKVFITPPSPNEGIEISTLERDIHRAWLFGNEIVQSLFPDKGASCVVAGSSVRDLWTSLYKEAYMQYISKFKSPYNPSNNPSKEESTILSFRPKDIDVFILGAKNHNDRVRMSTELFYSISDFLESSSSTPVDSYDFKHAIALPARSTLLVQTDSGPITYEGEVPVQVVFHAEDTVEGLLKSFDLKNCQFAYLGTPNLLCPGWDTVKNGKLSVNREGFIGQPITTLHRMFNYIDKYDMSESLIEASDLVFLSSLVLHQLTA